MLWGSRGRSPPVRALGAKRGASELTLAERVAG